MAWKGHTAPINQRNLDLFFFTCSLSMCRRFGVDPREAGQPFVVFQIILTADKSAHEFIHSVRRTPGEDAPGMYVV
jgi:hypothetical protein